MQNDSLGGRHRLWFRMRPAGAWRPCVALTAAQVEAVGKEVADVALSLPTCKLCPKLPPMAFNSFAAQTQTVGHGETGSETAFVSTSPAFGRSGANECTCFGRLASGPRPASCWAWGGNGQRSLPAGYCGEDRPRLRAAS